MHNDSFLCIAQLFFSYSVCTIFYMIPTEDVFMEKSDKLERIFNKLCHLNIRVHNLASRISYYEQDSSLSDLYNQLHSIEALIDKLDVQISAIEESSISDIEYKVESIVNKRLKNC